MLEATKGIGTGARTRVEASVSSRSSARASALNRRALGGAFALICAAMVSTAAAAENNLLAAYVVMGPDAAVARAIFDGKVICPTIKIELDTGSLPMDTRADPSGDRFPVTVCEKAIPPQTKSAAILGQKLPVPKASLSSIVVLGDTGCRPAQQSWPLPPQPPQCDPRLWPFKEVSSDAAHSGAAHSPPDLVIHVGDYRYRPPNLESDPNPDNDDNWKAWREDFFDPAKDLLGAAPWIMARGNHEICGRHGNAYFVLLHPGPIKAGWQVCSDPADPANPGKDDIPPYTVSLAGRHFIVFDSSGAPDQPKANDPTTQVQRYTKMFAALDPLLLTPGTWLITHVPIWSVPSNNEEQTLQTAFGNANIPQLRNIQLVLSGHIYLWEAIAFGNEGDEGDEDDEDQVGPPQFVLGNGGTNFSTKNPKCEDVKDIGGRAVNSCYIVTQRHGFTLFTPEGGKATAEFTAEFIDGPTLDCTIPSPPNEITCETNPDRPPLLTR